VSHDKPFKAFHGYRCDCYESHFVRLPWRSWAQGHMVFTFLNVHFNLTRKVSYEQKYRPKPNNAGQIVRRPMGLPITASCDTAWIRTRVSIVMPQALRCSALTCCTTRETFEIFSITDGVRERLKMSVKTLASWSVHALSTCPGNPSGSTAL
jgi:hypothetical protein